MHRTSYLAGVVFLAFLISACGGGGGNGGGSGNPASPSPAPQNRTPVVNNLNASPAFGVSQLTSFSFSASGSDPDGDSLTYTWDFGDGTTGTGQAFSKTYAGTGVATVRVTVSDGKGGSATDTRTVTVAGATGTWRSVQAPSALGWVRLFLTQAGSNVTGSYQDAAYSGQIDPAQPGRIGTDASIELRFKVAFYTDFTFRGTIDASGRRMSGAVYGSGFNGQALVLDLQ